jgi:ferrochelatase
MLNGDALFMPVAFAFRYCSPTIEDTVRRLHSDGINTIRMIPLFPHYTHAMTGSVVKEARRVCESLGLTLFVTPAWGNKDEITALWSQYLDDAMNSFGNDARVLFVAHGIPRRDLSLGDDYTTQVQRTARAVARILPEGTEWSLAYQSKVGPIPWTKPYLEKEIDKLSRDDKPLIIMPLSFAADCLETLYDLDLVAFQRARAAGAKRVIRVRVFNDDQHFASALVSMVKEKEYA